MNKKSLFLIITVLTATSPTCDAMKRPSETTISEKTNHLIPAKKPRAVACFPNNIVAISSPDDCSIYDFSANKKIMELSNTNELRERQSIVAHPNGKVVAFYRNETLKIHDITTGNKIGECCVDTTQCPPTFNPVHDTILICKDIQTIESFDYKTNSCRSYSIPALNQIQPIIKIAHHPTKEELILLDGSYKLNIVQLNTNPATKITIPIKEPVIDASYSPDGSCIALNLGEYGCNILNTKTHTYKDLISDKNEWLGDMVFKPNSFILATVSNQDKQIYCWNTKTEKLIASIPLASTKKYHNANQNSGNQRINFSCDGTKLITAYNDECFIIKVPFEAIYQPNAKNKSLFAYWTLQQNNTIPHDIKILLIQYLLETFKFSLTNY